jgi:hypothetical protein
MRINFRIKIYIRLPLITSLIINKYLFFYRQKRAETSACYPEVGCFDTSGPYGYIGMVPNAPDEVNTEYLRVFFNRFLHHYHWCDIIREHVFQVNTRFLLYSSRRSRRDTPLLDVAFKNMTSIWHWAGKAFNVSAPTKVIVHGFGSSCSNVWVYEMRSALMDVVSNPYGEAFPKTKCMFRNAAPIIRVFLLKFKHTSWQIPFIINSENRSIESKTNVP